MPVAEVFLDGFLQAVNFVNEQYITFLKIGEQPGEVGGLLNRRSGWCS